jgi:hypothetical protein
MMTPSENTHETADVTTTTVCRLDKTMLNVT